VLGATGESLVHVGAEPWHQDHMHGAQIDRSIGLVHHGVRHARVSDGLWMQPEPLLYLGPAKGVLERPLGYGPVYAAGDTNQLHDRSGRHPLVVALLAPIATATAAEVLVAGAIGVTAGTLAGCLAAPEQCQQTADDLAGMANGAAERVGVGVAGTAELTRRGLEALGDLWDGTDTTEVVEAPPTDVSADVPPDTKSDPTEGARQPFEQNKPGRKGQGKENNQKNRLLQEPLAMLLPDALRPRNAMKLRTSRSVVRRGGGLHGTPTDTTTLQPRGA
jgi:hypothetical protein